jgi:hypothetical protein
LKKDIAQGFTKLEALFAKLIKKTFVNVKTSEGVDVYFDGELMEGSKVFADEAMTVPAPDGVHTVDGKVFTITGGVVTKVEEVQAAKTELEIANEKIAELTASLEAKNTEVVNAKAETETVLATATELEKEFVALKSKIVTGKDQTFVATVDKPAPTPVKDWKAGVIELRKAKEATK